MHKRAWLMRTPPLALAILLLTGCVTAAPDLRPAVVTRCGSVAAISRAQQATAATELDGLPDGSVVAEIIIPDWQRMRDENRACRGAK